MNATYDYLKAKWGTLDMAKERIVKLNSQSLSKTILNIRIIVVTIVIYTMSL